MVSALPVSLPIPFQQETTKIWMSLCQMSKSVLVLPVQPHDSKHGSKQHILTTDNYKAIVHSYFLYYFIILFAYFKYTWNCNLPRIWSPYLFIDGIELLLQHERQSLSIWLATGGKQGRADIVIQVRLGLDVAAEEVTDAAAQGGVVLLKHRAHLKQQTWVLTQLRILQR